MYSTRSQSWATQLYGQLLSGEEWRASQGWQKSQCWTNFFISDLQFHLPKGTKTNLLKKSQMICKLSLRFWSACGLTGTMASLNHSDLVALSCAKYKTKSLSTANLRIQKVVSRLHSKQERYTRLGNSFRLWETKVVPKLRCKFTSARIFPTLTLT